MDGYLQLAEHLRLLQLADGAEREVFVFQAVVDKVVGGDAFAQQAAHLVEHSRPHAGLQTCRDASAALVASGVESQRHTAQRLARAARGVGAAALQSQLAVVLGNLDGADGALWRIGVGGVVQGLILCENGRQFVDALSRQTCPERGVLRRGVDAVVAQHALDVEARAAAEDGDAAAPAHVVKGAAEVLLIAEQVVACARLDDVDEVVGHVVALHVVVVEVFSRAHVHAAIYLPAVAADDFGVEQRGQPCGEGRLSGGRRADDGDEVVGKHGVGRIG